MNRAYSQICSFHLPNLEREGNTRQIMINGNIDIICPVDSSLRYYIHITEKDLRNKQNLLDPRQIMSIHAKLVT